MRIYSERLGRFLSVDPITADYPELTPYQFASNSPLAFIDLDGLEAAYRMPDGSVYMQTPSDHNIVPIPQYVRDNGVFIGGGKDKFGAATTSITYDLVPGVGTAKGLVEAFSGEDLVTGEKLKWWERGLNLIPFVKGVRKIIKGAKTINKVTDVAVVTSKTVEQTTTVSKVYKNSKLNAIASQYGDDIAQTAYDAGKGGGTNKLRSALISAGKGLNGKWQAHHLLPTELLEKSNILRQAVRQGFDFNGAVNGIALDLSKHFGSHPEYTQMVLTTLEANFKQFRKSKNFKEIAEMTANQVRETIITTTGKLK